MEEEKGPFVGSLVEPIKADGPLSFGTREASYNLFKKFIEIFFILIKINYKTKVL